MGHELSQAEQKAVQLLERTWGRLEQRATELRLRRGEIQTQRLAGLANPQADLGSWLRDIGDMTTVAELNDHIAYLTKQANDLKSIAAEINNRELAEDANWNFPVQFNSPAERDDALAEAERLEQSMNREFIAYGKLQADILQSSEHEARIAELDSHMMRLRPEVIRLQGLRGSPSSGR